MRILEESSAFVLTAALALLSPIPATAGEGEIMFVNSFEGTGNVPQFVPVDEQAAAAGRLLVVDVDTSDPANQAGLTFSLTDAPSGMSIRAGNGEIVWTPTVGQVGSESVTVRVEDLAGLSNTLTFGVQVVDPSASPLIEPIPDQTIRVGDDYQYLVVATDPDPGDSVVFSLDDAPAGLLVDPGTGVLSWMPDNAAVGTHPVAVRATDTTGRSDIGTFELTVVADNQPPTLEAIADRGAAPGVTLSLQAQAFDPDTGDALTYSLSERPSGMTVDAITGLLQWTPTPLQLGPHTVTLTVTDPFGFSDTQSFEVFVDTNRPPVAIDDDGYRVERGDTLVVPADGVLANDSDPNDDLLSAQPVTGPQRGTLALDADGGFEYTPDNPAGTIDVTQKWALNRPLGASVWSWQPLIANLDDDPASEIVVTYRTGGCCDSFLIALDGQSGDIDWQRVFSGRQIATQSKPAIGDIDLDGKPEIIVAGGEADAFPTLATRLYAFEHDGHIKWISEPLGEKLFPVGSDSQASEGLMSRTAITLADLDGDGTPEILVAPGSASSVNARVQIWDNQGRKLDGYSEPDTVMGGGDTRTTVVDLDLDGDPEIVVGNVAWSHDGELLWARKDNFTNFQVMNYPIVANLDDDPYPELVRTRGATTPAPGDQRGNIVAWNHDGTDLWEVPRPFGSTWAPISIADLDADGYAEVLYGWNTSSDRFDVLDGRDGSVKWSKNVTTGPSGASAIDMDGDGFVEVVFVDESGTLHVWDGRDGVGNGVFDLDQPRPARFTVPVFADVDADGVAELVIPGGPDVSVAEVVSVWESPADDWPPMRSIWNQQRYHVTNVNDDLTIPARERPHWLLPGLNQAMINARLPESRTEEHDTFTYRASDGEFDSNEATVSITILPPNAPPRIVSTPRTLASSGFEYVYRALAVDADAGETLAWSLAEGPPGMTIDALGAVRWTPSAGDLGEHTIAIEVNDSVGVSAFQAFVIEVVPALTVPDLAGLTEAQATAAVEAAGLVVDPLRDTFSDVVPAGQVAAQQPPPGTAIAAGGAVEVEISRGPVPVQVPDTIALELDDALAALFAAGLDEGTVTFVNNSQPVDTVLSQDPAPRALVAPGSPVDLAVSGGPRALISITPDVIPAGGTASVTVSIRDVDGTPLDPQPDVTLALNVDPAALAGTPPTLDGSTITTFADSQGPFAVEVSFDTEVRSAQAVVAQPISDGPGADVYSEFAEQLEDYGVLIEQLIEAVDSNDTAAILAADAALGDLLDALDTRRLRTLSPVAPDGGVPPSPSIAQAAGFAPGPDDLAYREATLDLLAVIEQLEQVVVEGSAPDAVIDALNQELSESASALAALEPEVYGVLDASGAIISLLGTRVPRLLRADIEAVRRELREADIISRDGTAGAGRFTLPGIMTASSIRQSITSDFYVPYLGDVARAMGTIAAADLLQPYVNGGAVVGVVTGGSLALHVFEIPNSVIEGFGFNPTLSPNNAVTMLGPELFDAVQDALGGLPSAADFRDLNTIMDTVQAQVDNADAVGQAWDEANSSPMGIQRGCILDNLPTCRQLVYPDGFASVYKADSGLSLPAPVIIIVRNLESGGMAIFVANFIPTSGDDGR